MNIFMKNILKIADCMDQRLIMTVDVDIFANRSARCMMQMKIT